MISLQIIRSLSPRRKGAKVQKQVPDSTTRNIPERKSFAIAVGIMRLGEAFPCCPKIVIEPMMTVRMFCCADHADLRDLANASN